MVKNPPANAGRCRRLRFVPWSRKIPHAAEQLSPCPTTIEPVLSSPGAATAEVPTGNRLPDPSQKPLPSLPPPAGGGVGRTRAEFPHGISQQEKNPAGSPLPAKLRAPALPTQAGPGAVPGGPECTAAGAEAAEGGAAAPTGVLLSGGNIRSCFLIFSFLK